MNQNIPQYIDLIKLFVLHQIGAKQFEQEYLQLFKNNKTLHSEDVFDAISDLFAAVDDYCDDPELRAELPQLLDDQGLWDAANLALKRLQMLCPNIQ